MRAALKAHGLLHPLKPTASRPLLCPMQALLTRTARAHQACLPHGGCTHVSESSITSANGQVCRDALGASDGMCCSVSDEARVVDRYRATLPANASARCQVRVCLRILWHMHVNALAPASIAIKE